MTDVRAPRCRRSWPRPGWWRCSPSGRRRGRPTSEPRSLDGRASRADVGGGRPFGHRRLLRVGRVRAAGRAPASTVIRGPRRARWTCSSRTIRPWPTSGRPGEWHDEVYLFRELRPDARCCWPPGRAELDGGDVTPTGGAIPDLSAYPLSWCFTEGAGRVFSTSLGHFPHAWESPTICRHLAGGSLAGLGEPAALRPSRAPSGRISRIDRRRTLHHHRLPARHGDESPSRRRSGAGCQEPPDRARQRPPTPPASPTCDQPRSVPPPAPRPGPGDRPRER